MIPIIAATGFQSTLPRGERQLPKITRKKVCYFNPRSREGSDNDIILNCHNTYISIHAPARGATVPCRDDWSIDCISIHAPARGATLMPLLDNTDGSISIHAPARGATLLVLATWYFIIIFQSTLPRGERPLTSNL